MDLPKMCIPYKVIHGITSQYIFLPENNYNHSFFFLKETNKKNLQIFAKANTSFKLLI